MIFEMFKRFFMSRFEKIRREFTANVSHELKTPLQSISGAAELLRSGVVKESDREKFLDIIIAESRRMNRIVGDIIVLSKLDSDVWMHEKEDVDFIGLTREDVEALRGAADKASVKLSLSTPLKSDRTVRGSLHYLESLVSNLLDNAVHYNRPGGAVDVVLRYGKDHLTLTVADTGIGIDKTHHKRIFERFYRVDKGRSRSSGGTGLGLSIVRNAVRLHKGEITLESSPGSGSTFTVALPYG
jgi:two-component system phosphate regulon sensor histidine kinase PhoR